MPNVLAWRDEISSKMPEKKSRIIHFSKMSHPQKVVAVQCISQRPIRAINVVCNKVVIPPGIYNEKNQLYCYMTRYLVERISWLCRDYRLPNDTGDGRVQIIFSRRGGMSYEDFCAYLHHLRGMGAQTRIHWPVVDIDGIEARDHSTFAGLQLADAVASAFACGFEPDKFGNCESRYAEILKPIVYHRPGNYLSYGLKIVPNANGLQLTADQTRTLDLFK